MNGKRVNCDLTCETGDLVEVYLSESAFSESLPAPVYKDGNVLVLNKRDGITSEDFYKSVLSVYPSARAVHRLDRNTRGIMIFALNESAEKELLYGFRNRTFSKYYLAEVIGRPEPSAAVLTAYLGKDAENSFVRVYSTPQTGLKKIQTAYKTRKNGEFTSVLEVELLTGRTHQIRAHLKHIGHPIVGDEKYGDASFNKSAGVHRQRLQAYKIILRFGKDSPLCYLNGKEFSVGGDMET